MNQVKTNKISKYALSLIAVATLSCSSLSFGINISQAIEKKDIKRVAEILEDTSFDVNKADNIDRTPLNHACSSNNPEIVTLLLKSGAKESINKVDKLGWTPLNWACFNTNLELVKLLLAGSADANIATVSGCTPLNVACINNNPDIVKLLLANGANVDQRLLNVARNKQEIPRLLTLVQNYDKKIKTGEYFRLPENKRYDRHPEIERDYKKLLAFLDKLNETRKKIILNKLKKELPGQLKQNEEKKIEKFGNVEFKYQDNSKDDNKVTEVYASPGEFKLIEKRKREE
ncbi:MAG: Ankyrin [candidate division TM6 bacterium GW2011_GWF2_30_66]|nr:MAG: Ankyrin [candidate division TM6 bacterium GW2011_GWF2_30_66]